MSSPTRPRLSKQAVLHLIALIVALCSFAYELVYSELLTVMYGGTVTQYGLTIGLFFSSLGIGSYLSQQFNEIKHENFIRTQFLLSLTAPLGFLLIIWLNTTTFPDFVPLLIPRIVARMPIIAIGVLSGFELPLLLKMVDEEYDEETPPAQWVKTLGSYADAVAHKCMSVVFHTSANSKEYNTYSTVLAMDYLGGLCGALLFVFILYPSVGLIPSIFILGLLNGVAAIVFILRFSDNQWGLFKTEDRKIITQERKSVFVGILLITSIYAGIGIQHEQTNQKISQYYTESLIEQEYIQDTMAIDVTEQYTTKYQQVTKYTRTWQGESKNQIFAGNNETCMRLDNAIQMCESWIKPYHSGLVDVPLSTYQNSTNTDVLLVGGGDWIAANHLRDHNVSVDQVDLDGEFMDRMKTDPLVSPHHENAYQYENMTSHQADIYAYLQDTDKQYDLIILDLPGAKNDDLLHLYSEEFYQMLNTHLTTNGQIVTWAYSEYTYGNHENILMNTLNEAGFSTMAEYHARSDYNNNGETRRGERFLLLRKSTPNTAPINPENGSAYVKNYKNVYSTVQWESTPTYNGIEVNSIFKPNHKLIINNRLRAKQGIK